MGCCQSNDDTKTAIIKPTGIKDEWIIAVTAQKVINGLVRLKLDNWNYFIKFRYDLDENIRFRLHYKKRDALNWKIVEFDAAEIRCAPEVHINIRVDVNLLDYNMEFKISTQLNNNIISMADMKEHIRPNIWLPPSNTVSVHIPSSMKELTFEREQMVRFHVPESSNSKYSYGTINRVTGANDDRTYEISHYRTGKKYQIKDNKCERNASIKHLSAHSYVDLTSIIEMESILLIGNRMGVENKSVMDLYLCLNGIFYSEYIQKLSIDSKRIHQQSMVKCVSLNVINYLYKKEERYKIKCMLMNELSADHIHFDDTLRLIPQREYAVNRAFVLKEQSYYFEYYCDQCLCVQGDYYWMYRCMREANGKYDGHDICLNCVYDVIKKCRQLKHLLDKLLVNELTDDCIQTIVVYTAGNVVKL